ncbi:hypothetical protein L4D09_07815 [Photobacterium makurazakiensis]|uniref:hypothetical protein n=1 Tax=Photobacterium makurazakiensis TaxID=2910234 RepID=UPI003D0CC2CF
MNTSSNLSINKTHLSILKLKGVLVVHDLHLCQLDEGGWFLGARIDIDNKNSDLMKEQIINLLNNEFGIYNTSIEISQNCVDKKTFFSIDQL